MALKKGYLPKFIQRRTFDVAMFFYVDAIHNEFPNVSIHKAIKMFASRYELTVDDFSEESAYQTYQRMNSEMREHERERKKV